MSDGREGVLTIASGLGTRLVALPHLQAWDTSALRSAWSWRYVELPGKGSPELVLLVGWPESVVERGFRGRGCLEEVASGSRDNWSGRATPTILQSSEQRILVLN